jgi:hypothetical protein
MRTSSIPNKPLAASNASWFGNPRQMQTLVQVMETVVEDSLIPIKWGHYAETQEAAARGRRVSRNPKL